MSKDSGDSKRRKSVLLPTSDVLQSILQNSKSPLFHGFTRWKVLREWPSIVGAEIAKRCEPIAYRHGILYLQARNSIYMQELGFFKNDIQKKVNDKLQRPWVRQLKIVLNSSQLPKEVVTEENLQKLANLESEPKID